MLSAASLCATLAYACVAQCKTEWYAHKQVRLYKECVVECQVEQRRCVDEG